MSVSRRKFVKGGLASLASLAAGGLKALPALAALEPKTRTYRLVAEAKKISLGLGPEFTAWTYNGQVPGPEIRLKEGEILRVELINKLPAGTTIHWHGLPVPNAMDGVPGLTQKAVPTGGRFVYQFKAGPAGSYLYHSHAGYQLDQGLYGPLIVEPARPGRGYDQEFVLMLEDWVSRDGGGPAALDRKPLMGHHMGRGMMGRGMMGRGMMGPGPGTGGPLGEPVYDAFAVNGRKGDLIKPLVVNRGDRVRLRLMNPSSSTVYILRLSGHRLTVTHLDGQPVQPQETDVVRLGMGERLDVEFRADNPGNWLLAALDQGWGEGSLKVPLLYRGVRVAEPTPPAFNASARLLSYWDLRAARPQENGSGSAPKRYYRQVLSGGMHSVYWTINGYVHPDSERLAVSKGDLVRLDYMAHGPMVHPMHLHGHFFRVVNPRLDPRWWIKKDTIVVGHMERILVELEADNPGRWLHHCHNLYHMNAGMANTLEYQ